VRTLGGLEATALMSVETEAHGQLFIYYVPVHSAPEVKSPIVLMEHEKSGRGTRALTLSVPEAVELYKALGALLSFGP
jgi:hypothetical protein